jgi:hypothetical protein
MAETREEMERTRFNNGAVAAPGIPWVDRTNTSENSFKWTGKPGIDAGQPRESAQPSNERKPVSADVLALANELGQAGIPWEAASKLAAIILGMRSEIAEQAGQIRFLQDRLNAAGL